jgi:hypothetical protein
MEGNTKQTRAYEGVQPIPSGVRIELAPGLTETTYWGILCRTCRELVAFDICPYVSFGPGAANMRPGAIRCCHDHNHIYFPRDFGFFPSVVRITDAAMHKNRETFRAINPSSPVSSNRPPWKAKEPKADHEPNVPPKAPEGGKARPESLLPDARREAAQIAAKQRWANWATKKVV